MSQHVADPSAPRPTPHHYMNADGFCHAGDMFEAGTPSMPLYSAEELVRIVNAEKAEAWDEGWRAAWSPMSMHNLNDAPNPYTPATAPEMETNDA